MKHNTTRIAAAVLLFAGAAVAQAIAASPASAAPSSVTQGASATNSVAKKSATAVCPQGTRVYGGGGDITNGGHEVALTGLRPASILLAGRYYDSYTAIAEEDDTGYTANWAVYAYAICGPTQPNQTLVRSQLTSHAGSDRLEGGVTCPSGTAPLGLGGEIGNGAGNVVLTNVTGNYVLNAFGVPYGWGGAKAFIDETGYTGTWTLTTYAVCATPPPGLTYVFKDSAASSADKPNTASECPAGSKVYGAGGYTNWNFGQVHFDRMVPHGTYWTGSDVDTREDQTGTGVNWAVTSEAICAR
jgi:hypothetical protein